MRQRQEAPAKDVDPALIERITKPYVPLDLTRKERVRLSQMIRTDMIRLPRLVS